MATSQNSRYANNSNSVAGKNNTWNLKAVALTLKSSLSSPCPSRTFDLEWKHRSDMQNSLTFIVFIFISFVSSNSSSFIIAMQSTAYHIVESNIVSSVYSYNFTNSSNFCSRRSFFNSRLGFQCELRFFNASFLFSILVFFFNSSFNGIEENVSRMWILNFRRNVQEFLGIFEEKSYLLSKTFASSLLLLYKKHWIH